MSEPQRRFVVLHHVSREDEHWDLMIETGKVLATWRLASPPHEANSVEARTPCRRISDHRIPYLDFEGPISGDRGHVTRADLGTCLIESEAPDRWIVRFEGQILQGLFSIDSVCRERDGQFVRVS